MVANEFNFQFWWNYLRWYFQVEKN